MKKRYAIHTITGKLFLQLLFIFGCLLCLISLTQFGIMKVARTEIYDRMSNQADHYLDKLDESLVQIRRQQLSSLNDWDMINITVNYDSMSGYERRLALLALRERMGFFEIGFDIVEDARVYIPGIDYVITGSSVKRMTEEDADIVEKSAGNTDREIHMDGTGVYMLSVHQEVRNGNNSLRQLHVVELAPKQIEKEIRQLVFGLDSGAFFMGEDREIRFHNGEDRELSFAIAKSLKEGRDGLQKIQEVRVDGKTYLSYVSESRQFGTFVQYMQQDTVMREISKYRKWLLAVWICTLAAVLAIMLFLRKQIHRPVRTLLEAFEKVKTGAFGERIYYEGKDEFQSLYSGFNEMQEQMQGLIEGLAEQKNLTKNAQLKQLQAQITPHFLYNSFFVLSRRIKREDYEGASRFAELLGDYFRFVTKNASDDTTLQEEVEHARCYAQIQGSRFRRRIQVQFPELPEKYAQIRVPRLIVQPLLENAFGHGLEDKVTDGILRVDFAESDDCFAIVVEDNGDMASGETIEGMERRLRESADGETTGIVNIHRRLQLYFKGGAGLQVERSGLGGVKIGIVIDKKAMPQTQE